MNEVKQAEDYLQSNTLIAFSLYTDIQYKMVRVLGEEIIKCLDESIFVDERGQVRIVLRGRFTDEAYSKFWFWTLGAYEVVRTMCGAKKCLSGELLENLSQLKKKLSVLRIPFAKQELNQEKVPVNAELSIYTISISPSDYKFRIKNTIISA